MQEGEDDEDILSTDTRIPPTTQHAEQVICGGLL